MKFLNYANREAAKIDQGGDPKQILMKLYVSFQEKMDQGSNPKPKFHRLWDWK